MANYFLDASALVKRYAPEVGSAWVASLVLPVNLLIASEISQVEVPAALAKKERTSEITTADRVRYVGLFSNDCALGDYRFARIDPPTIRRAASLAQSQALRAGDAIQLATALLANSPLAAAGAPLTFVSADVRLCWAAHVEGLAVDDPNAHP